MSTTLDIITDALSDIGISGIDGPAPEHVERALRKFNARGLNWNTRERFKKFERMQTFPVVAAQDSYTIGQAADTPDFVVAAGKRPLLIDRAFWRVALASADPGYPLDVVNDYRGYADAGWRRDRAVGWPLTLYYQTTSPNGTLWIRPGTFDLTNGLELYWWDQFTTVSIDDVASDLGWPDGYELAFELTLAEDLCLPFGKDCPAQLEKSAAAARADLQSHNVSPPQLDTSGEY